MDNVNKKEQLKRLEQIALLYNTMMLSFKSAIEEKEAQLIQLNEQINALKEEIKKEEEKA